jgi:citrate synthase
MVNLESIYQSMGPSPAENVISSVEATRRLGVAAGTLYAYVSRGLVRSFPHPADPRARLYAAADVEALIRRKTRMRRPAGAAATALDWGLPVLATKLSSIESGRLAYRGQDATLLAEDGTLEGTARLLWGIESDPFAGLRFDPGRIAGWSRTAALTADAMPTDRALALLPLLLKDDPAVAAGAPGAALAARLVLALAAAMAGPSYRADMALHEGLARAWRRPRAADAIRRALVLSADHELNPSTFAVRVVASTGARLTVCLLAGLAALSGPRHGGMVARVRALLEEAERIGDPLAAVDARLRRGDLIPGFQHPLYPEGDPRARALLAHIRLHPLAGGVIAAIRRLTGHRPTIDVALAALEMSHGLPKGAALALFALGRSVGWIAHAFEQQAAGTLIRPRATAGADADSN